MHACVCVYVGVVFAFVAVFWFTDELALTPRRHDFACSHVPQIHRQSAGRLCCASSSGRRFSRRTSREVFWKARAGEIALFR